MKVCENCGEEISTKDGDNLCRACEERQDDKVAMRLRRGMRNDRGAAMLALGLVKVRGALGGTYWE